jgi:hypothetical protein
MVVEIKTVDCVTHIKRTKVPFKSLLFILQKKEGIEYFSFILFYKREERGD